MSFGLTLCFEHLETFIHGLANLFGSLLLIIELLFIHAIFSCKKHSEFFTTCLEVSGVAFAQICDSVFNNLFLDDSVSFVFPFCCKS